MGLKESGLSLFGYAQVVPMYAAFMFVVCCGITSESLTKAATNYRALGLALALKAVFLPLLCVVVNLLFFAPPPLAAALIYVSLIPPYTVALYLSWLSRGDLALAVCLLVMVNVFAFAYMPVAMWLVSVFGPDGYEAYDPGMALYKLVMITAVFGFIVPGLLGVLCRERLESLSKTIYFYGMRLFLLVFIFTPLIAIYPLIDIAVHSFPGAGVSVIFAFLLFFIFAYFAVNSMYRDIAGTRSIVFTVVCGNSVLGAAVMVSPGEVLDEVYGAMTWWFISQYYLGMLIALYLRFTKAQGSEQATSSA